MANITSNMHINNKTYEKRKLQSKHVIFRKTKFFAQPDVSVVKCIEIQSKILKFKHTHVAISEHLMLSMCVSSFIFSKLLCNTNLLLIGFHGN